jgi:hypothetical protein
MLTAAVLLGYSWWASGTTGWITPAAVGGAMVTGATVAIRSWIRHDRRVRTQGARLRFGGLHGLGVLRWSGVALLLVLWEARELLGSPRAMYPTVTSIVTGITAARAAKFAFFFLWLVIGSRLVEPGRRAEIQR